MIGTFVGDIVGSIYEWHNIKTKDFELFQDRCFFTDDSVMTCAVSDGIIEALSNGYCDDEPRAREIIADKMREYGVAHPHAGYGSHFKFWLSNELIGPYNSLGNGSAMRVASVGWIFNDIFEVRRWARISAEVTHNHPEGIRGAEAIASAVFFARMGESKEYIKSYIEREFGYDLEFTCDEIRDKYSFDVTCMGTVPQAIVAFLDSVSFEDAIRNAISIGGDSDTLAAITGSIAECFYGIPEWIEEEALSYLTPDLKESLDDFDCWIFRPTRGEAE